MCLILSLHQKEKDDRIKSVFKQIVLSNVSHHDDGVGILAINSETGDVYHNRAMLTSDAELQGVLDNYDIVNVHLRQGTSGELSTHNVHFWHRDDWFFAHNGMVSAYHGGARIDTTCKDTDSLQFFNELFAKKGLSNKGYVNLKKLDKLSDTKGFSGRCMFVHPKTNRIVYYGDFKTYNLDNKAVLVCSTTVGFKGITSLMGFQFEADDIIPNIAGDMDGLNVCNYKTKQLLHMDDNRKDSFNYSYNYGGYHQGYFPGLDGDDDDPDYPHGTVEYEIAKDIKKKEKKEEEKMQKQLEQFERDGLV